MLSKILQINQNFISTCIIILFGISMLLSTEAVFPYLTDSLSWILVLVFVMILVISLNATVYFQNQYFTFYLMLLAFAFYQGHNSLGFYAGLLFLSILQSQIIMEIRYGNAVLNSFDIGFFSGFMVLFYSPFIIFLVPLWVYYLILGKVEISKFLMHLLGLFAFFILFIELIAVFDWWGIWNNLYHSLTFNLFEFSTSDLFLIPILMLLTVAALDYFFNINRHANHKKLIFFNSTISLLSAIVFLILWGGANKEYFLLIIFPAALYLTNYMTYNKELAKKEVYLWVLIISVLLYKFNQYIAFPSLFDNITF
ncbi:hypothetical protein GO491_07855 [Flavobacteriaceae bacterium Ap0902]|nr:hypothetical protein [Flavobacteriaceae bacterium Ap0902]